MKYRVINEELNNFDNVRNTFFLNRGVANWKEYMNIKDNVVNDCLTLDNIQIATDTFIKHLSSGTRIHIIQDCDADGLCSFAMLYKYIKEYDSDIVVTYSIHTGKQHGLSDDIVIPEDCGLLIIPDAGSNDVEQCKALKEEGIDIIILDHHICDVENPYAIVVNNQMCDYKNKDFCGAGIVQRFLENVDSELWLNISDDLVDLCALGNISDVMDMRSFETKYYVDKGLSHIRSKAFKALIDKQEYSIGGNVNNVQFYITPLINGMIRFGKEDEKELLARAFIETDEVFDYKKRTGEVVKETIYERVARLCTNAKNRQDKAVKTETSEIVTMIDSLCLNNNKVIFADVTNKLSSTLTGLVAMKLCDKYMKPCVLLKASDEYTFGGSCRNFNNSPVDSLKDTLLETNCFEFVQGHDNAAGVSIKKDNVVNAIKRTNRLLKDVKFEKIYSVDFEIDYEDLNVSHIRSIDEIKDYFGQGLKEPFVAVLNIPIIRKYCEVLGKYEDKTWKILDEYAGIQTVMFRRRYGEDEILDWTFDEGNPDDTVYINAICRLGFNNFKGILTPQIVITDYEVIDNG